MGLLLITWNVDRRPKKTHKENIFIHYKCVTDKLWHYSSWWKSPSSLGEQEPDDDKEEEEEEERDDGNVAADH